MLTTDELAAIRVRCEERVRLRAIPRHGQRAREETLCWEIAERTPALLDDAAEARRIIGALVATGERVADRVFNGEGMDGWHEAFDALLVALTDARAAMGEEAGT